MSKVVLFSTRAIGGNTLFGTNYTRCILNSDDSPIFKYFIEGGATDDEKKELGNNFPPSSCFDEIKKHCSQIGVWKVDYEKMEEEDVLDNLNEELNNDEQYKSLLTKYYSSGNQASIEFNLNSFKEYLSKEPNNHDKKSIIRLALNIDNPNTDVAVEERFSIYVKPQSIENTEFVFMAIWPLGRTEERKKENGYNVWISTLVQQICNVVENCEEIILLLHDKDICGDQPFKVIISQKEYKVDLSRNVNLSVAIFQHAPGDPIYDILIKPETNLSSVYDSISSILTKNCDMTNAGKAHTTRQVYHNLVNELDKNNQAE